MANAAKKEGEDDKRGGDDDDDAAKYKKALLKKLRLQIAAREKLSNVNKKSVDDDDGGKGVAAGGRKVVDEKQRAKANGVEKTLEQLETRLGVSRDSEEVKECFRVAIEDLSKKRKKKKSKKKKKRDEREEDEVGRGNKKQKHSASSNNKKYKNNNIVDDGKAMQAFHRLATAKETNEEYDETMKRAERCVRDVLSCVNRFDSFRTCSAQWSLATMSAKMAKKKNVFVEGGGNNSLREQVMMLRENLARRFKELAEKADARACATNLWFLAQTSGTMSGGSGNESSASIKAAIKGLRLCKEDKISSQDGANALWGIAKLRVKSSPESEEIESVVAKLAERVVVAVGAAASSNSSNNSKEVSSATWALATMHVDGIILSGSSAKSSSSVALDLAILRVAKVVKKAFQKESKNATSWSESRVIANCVWSCAKLFSNALLTKDTRKVLREAVETALENENLWQNLEPRAFATLLSAAATIRASSSPTSSSSLKRLLKRALDCFEDTSTHGRDVTPADVCDLCEFIEAFTKDSKDNEVLEEADTDRVMKIVTDVSKTCDWRASGRLLSSAEALNVDARAKKRLLSSGVEAIKIMELDRFNVDEATVEILSRNIEEQLKSKSTKQRRVLIANCESRSEGKLRQMVEKFGHRFETWQRFSSGENSRNEKNTALNTNARPWPTVSERKCDYAFVRAVADKEALLFLMSAVATRVKVGGEVYLSGSRSEGFLNAFDAFNKNLYESPRRVPGQASVAHSPDSEDAKNGENDFAFALTAKVLSNGDEKNATLEAFKKVDSNVKLFGAAGDSSIIEAKKWTTFPGFFAKGGLDIMTSFLLDSVFEEDVKSSSTSVRLKKGVCGDKTKRVMDFCCGSGVIGYALLSALVDGKKNDKKKVKLTVLDADAVSLEAAKENLSLINENAVDYLLSDGFPTKPFKKPCELIFTNPPVHYQSKPDFRVLGKMLLHLPNVLKKRKKGTCFCVCQRYVPLESVAKYFIDDDARENGKGNRTQLDVEIHAKNDRFVVWKISLPS